MIDIDFYKKIYKIKKEIMSGKIFDKDFLFNEFEKKRSRNPVIFNIETTNKCNMKCVFCPRTTKMNRKITVLSMDNYKKIVEQIEPWSKNKWEEWMKFAINNYKVFPTEMNENHFFLYIVANVIILHGFGSPLLDKYMPKRIKLLSDKNIKSYFSCNASNVKFKNIEEIMDNGLSYLKFSVDSVNDQRHKQLRGQCSDFNESYKKIVKILDIISRNRYKTIIIITMIDLGLPNQLKEFSKLKKIFEDINVYMYFKSQDNKWYKQNGNENRSIHWTEFCQELWSSVTISSSGKVALCAQDYNESIIAGDSDKETLYDIWNGKKYKKFRRDHFDLNPYIKCSMECDRKLIGEFI